MICLSQSLMGVTVPFDLRVVYKFSNKFFKEILFVCRCSFLKEKTWQFFPLDLSLSVSTLGKIRILKANLINARNIKYSSLFSTFKTSSSFSPKQIKIWEFIPCGPFFSGQEDVSVFHGFTGKMNDGFLTSQSEIVSKSCYR